MMAGRVREYRLTDSGVNELKKELEDLKNRRLEVAERLKEAKEQLDLSENSDWAEAQDESKYIEGRIEEIEHVMRNVKIITSPVGASEVELGCTVHLRHNGKTLEYTLVGSLEANPEARKISEESPLGQALLGKKVSDKIEIKTSTGQNIYTVAKIS